MDNLARNAMLAKQAGMSYGKWKSLQPRVEVEKKPPEGWIPCEYCGKYFKPTMNKRFCEMACQRKSYDERTRKESNNEN